MKDIFKDSFPYYYLDIVAIWVLFNVDGANNVPPLS